MAELNAGTKLRAVDLDPLETIVVGEWQTMSLLNGWVHRNLTGEDGKFYRPSYRLVGGGTAVEVIGSAYKSGGGANGEILAVFPVGFRPESEIGVALPHNGGLTVALNLRQNGELFIGSPEVTGNTLNFNGTFLLIGPH